MKVLSFSGLFYQIQVLTCLCLSEDKYSIKINTKIQKFLVPFPLLIKSLSEFKAMKHLFLFQTSLFFFFPEKFLLQFCHPVLSFTGFTLLQALSISRSQWCEINTEISPTSIWSAYFYQVSWKDLRGCSTGSAYSLFSFIKELRPPLPLEEQEEAQKLFNADFFILEAHTYFFLTEADDNVRVQLKSFSEWRHFPGSELLHPALCPGYFFFHLLVLKEIMHSQGKLKSFPVLQLKDGKSTRWNTTKVMTRHILIYR